jgi:integrase
MAFKELDPRTQRVRRRILEATFEEPTKPGAETLFADFPLARMKAQHIEVLRDRRADKREAANARVKAIRRVFAFGLKARHVATDPSRDVETFGRKTAGFYAWTISDVQQYIARHPIGTKAYLALALLLYVGGRRADIPALGRQHFRGRWLQYTQHKNRNRDPVTLNLPVLPPLQAAIEAIPAPPASGTPQLTFLLTEYGKPFTANGFGNWFKKRCMEARLPRCSAHGLRKAGATLAAENGATEAQLMAIFGWKDPKQAAHYTRTARQKKLAGAAMHLISLDENENGSVPLSPGMASGGTKSPPK